MEGEFLIRKESRFSAADKSKVDRVEEANGGGAIDGGTTGCASDDPSPWDDNLAMASK